MAATYQLRIISQAATLYEGKVESIVVPTEEGFLGVLAHHAPLVSTLGNGPLGIREAGGQEQTWEIDGGFLEVSHNVATVLVDRLTEQESA